MARAGLLVKKSEKEAPIKGEFIRTFDVFVDDEYFEVAVQEPGGMPMISAMQQMPFALPSRAPQPVRPAPAAPKAPKPAVKEPPPAAPAEAEVEGTPLKAPMPGMIVRFKKSVGDVVSKGDKVVILEAMKMENALPAPVDGTITAINFSSGDSVSKDAVLCVIA